jgi:hypothetical protein
MRWEMIMNTGAESVRSLTVHPDGQGMLHENFVLVAAPASVERVSYSFLGLWNLQLRRAHASTRTVFNDAFPGFTMVRRTEDEPSSMSLDPGKAIPSFPWIPPWAWPVHQIIQDGHLDGSFRGSYLFADSVP